MTLHKLHLHQQPFDKVRNGQKTIEARLFDERRQRIEIGDEIDFINRADESLCRVKVHRLHRAPTFQELFTLCGPMEFGAESVEDAVKSIEKYYDYDEQLRYGVIGIEFVTERTPSRK